MEKEIPDYAEAIMGWKGLIATVDGHLGSPQVAAHWVPGKPLEAHCYHNRENSSHRVPVYGCNCGIHAAKEKRKAETYAQIAVDRSKGFYGCIVKVRMWGRVVVHEEGWRAQYAYPETVILLYGRDKKRAQEVADRIRSNYGCEVVTKCDKMTKFFDDHETGRRPPNPFGFIAIMYAIFWPALAALNFIQGEWGMGAFYTALSSFWYAYMYWLHRLRKKK